MRKVERSVPPKIKVTEKNHTRQSLTEFYCRGSVNLRIFGRFYEKAGSVSVCRLRVIQLKNGALQRASVISRASWLSECHAVLATVLIFIGA